MCAVVGIYAYGARALQVDATELRKIRDHMASRGPDGSGEWFSTDGKVGLGHRRLSIIDLTERASQPMASADGQLVTSFNGEIYNYRELRAGLEAEGCRFRTQSDTEVLLQLYEREGVGMLHRLRGMFAFALWDQRRQGMLLARDTFGIKPLYYADRKGTVRVASQVKALLAGGEVDRTPDPAGHAGFFLWGSVPSPWTLYKGIRQLPAGHSLWIDSQGAREPEPFLRVTDLLHDACAKPAQGSRDDALAAIAHAVRDSVRAHQVSDVPVGVFLSAGLDSAMLATLASQTGARPQTLTLAFAEYAETKSNEAPLAEDLAAHLSTRHATLMVRREDFAEDSHRLLQAMDQPTIDGVNTWFIAKAAASQGIKVALSGVGGDELFASYPSFSQLPRIRKIAAPLARFPSLGRHFRQATGPLFRRFTSPKYAGVLELGGSTTGAYLLRRGLYMPWELPEVMDPDLAREGLEELDARMWQPPFNAIGCDRLSVSALEMSMYMRNQLLRDTDWASMAHSLEIRTPFADVDLVRAVAPWFATHPGITKPEVAKVVAPELAQVLLHRPKTGFSVPVREWLLADQPHRTARGLRGWARVMYKRFNPSAPLTKQ